jgi:hypothetical protein
MWGIPILAHRVRHRLQSSKTRTTGSAGRSPPGPCGLSTTIPQLTRRSRRFQGPASRIGLVLLRAPDYSPLSCLADATILTAIPRADDSIAISSLQWRKPSSVLGTGLAPPGASPPPKRTQRLGNVCVSRESLSENRDPYKSRTSTVKSRRRKGETVILRTFG